MKKLQSLALSVSLATLCGATTVQADQSFSTKMNLEALKSNESVTRLIVKYKPGAAPTNRLNERMGKLSSVAADLGIDLNFNRKLASGADLINLNIPMSGKALERVMARFAADSQVMYVEPDVRFTHQYVPNDSRYNEQWHYFESTAGMKLPAAWDQADGTGAVVAVLDTGYVYHSDLDSNIIPGYDFISDSGTARDGNGRDSDASDPGDWYGWFECGFFPANSSWHGTHVAGTIAATTGNNKGVSGVAYNASVMPVRVLGKCGGSLSDISDAIIWSSGGTVAGVPNTSTPADVINLSLGGSGSCGAAMQDAINTAVGNGTTVVVAAGNSSADASGFQPASCNNVVTVAATDRQGNLASYSNYGAIVDVSAPGGETATQANGVLSTLNSGSQGPAAESYAFYQGTSMATPHVAGLVALMKGLDSTLTPAQVEAMLKTNARAFAGTCNQCGAGLVDAEATVNDVITP